MNIEIRPATLFDAWLVALRGDEFTQRYDAGGWQEFIDKQTTSLCVMHVGCMVVLRAYGKYGIQEIHPHWVAIANRAAQQLGYESLTDANDNGRVPFVVLADALERARDEVEAEMGMVAQGVMSR